jgi:hypothetical protein
MTCTTEATPASARHVKIFKQWAAQEGVLGGRHGDAASMVAQKHSTAHVTHGLAVGETGLVLPGAVEVGHAVKLGQQKRREAVPSTKSSQQRSEGTRCRPRPQVRKPLSRCA